MQGLLAPRDVWCMRRHDSCFGLDDVLAILLNILFFSGANAETYSCISYFIGHFQKMNFVRLKLEFFQCLLFETILLSVFDFVLFS